MIITYDEKRDSATYGSGFIEESGFYKGVIKQCWTETKDSGAVFVYFDIETSGGDVSFNFCIQAKNGDETFAFGHLDSLIVIFDLDELKTTNGTVEVYSWEEGAKVKKPAQTFTCLVNREVGFFIQREFYINNKGEEKFKFQLRHFFRALDAKTSREIKENKPASFYKTMEKRYPKEMINIGNYEYVPYDDYKKQQESSTDNRYNTRANDDYSFENYSGSKPKAYNHSSNNQPSVDSWNQNDSIIDEDELPF